MKIAVLNKSGNIGKTTISTSLIKSRLPEGTRLYSIEDTNAGAEMEGIEVEKFKGKKFGDLQEELLREEHAIVDVGSSNVTDWLKYMEQYSGSHEEFDYFVVPVLNDPKILRETISTIRTLKTMGVEKRKIRVIFNKVDTDDIIEDDFASIFGMAEIEKNCVVTSKATIYENDIYRLLKINSISITEVVADETDYRAALRAATTEDEKKYAIARIQLKQLAKSATKNLDDVYSAVFK